MLVSGFKPVDEVLGPLFSTPLKTPSLIVLGRKDPIVVPERARTLVNVCNHPWVVEHDGGDSLGAVHPELLLTTK